MEYGGIDEQSTVPLFDPDEAARFVLARDLLDGAIGWFSGEIANLEAQQAAYARERLELRMGSPAVEEIIARVGPLVKERYARPMGDGD